MPVFKKKYEEIDKHERQIGKVIELACGYQGFTGAFQSMAASYGVKVPDDEAAKFIMAWRENRQKTVELWQGLQEAALKAVKLKNVFTFGRIKFGIRGRFLHIRLPSGRLLSYLDPYTKTEEDKYGRTREVICYKGVNDKGLFVEEHTYGGKLTENVVQAISRDLLANSLLNLDATGFDVVMHVHDEVIAELDEAQATEENFKRFTQTMEKIPAWAEGIPINVAGWIGKRYRKD
jgi:DNA polymerase